MGTIPDLKLPEAEEESPTPFTVVDTIMALGCMEAGGGGNCGDKNVEFYQHSNIVVQYIKEMNNHLLLHDVPVWT